MITGSTQLIAHVGHPTHTFTAPRIYNPYFAQAGVDAVVVPMGCRREHFDAFLPALFSLTNILGALITMPHKVRTATLLDVASPAVQVAGACNAVRLGQHGQLEGDLFDGEGFVRGLRRKGCRIEGACAHVVGCGGVGAAIAAALAGAGVAELVLFDLDAGVAARLTERLREHHPEVHASAGPRDPQGAHIVVNATPLGMQPDDPLPFDVDRLAAGTFVGDVVLGRNPTPLLTAALGRGCQVQPGIDMLYEQVPAYLAFFGLPVTTPAHLRAVARLGD